MIVKVDGWYHEVPEEAQFLEFFSGDGQKGSLTAYTAGGEELETPWIKDAVSPERHWTQRVHP